LDAAADGLLDTEQGLRDITESILNEPAATETLRLFHSELFRFHNYLSIIKDSEDVPEYSPALNDELMLASELFFDRIFTESLGLVDVLTSTTGYVGPAMAPLYGLEAPRSGMQEVELGPEHLIGLLASFVVGKKVIATLEHWVGRLPLVQTIYGATKRFLQTVSKPPVQGQRVVLINFPSPDMKAVGLITKVMRDAATGEELAVVYVPTSPNPTSGYIEILPLANVVMTDWTMEEAMSFVMTGGTNAPDTVRFNNPPCAADLPPAP
jgi:uncharacterized membrane protein